MFNLAIGNFSPADPVNESPDHEFKNFHRQLCERFGYQYDEENWKRDQLSLIEWIAKSLSMGEPVAEILGFDTVQDPRGHKLIPLLKWSVSLWEGEMPLKPGPLYAERGDLK